MKVKVFGHKGDGKTMPKKLFLHYLLMKPDGDIVIQRKVNDRIAFRVAHKSYNLGDDLDKNLSYMRRVMFLLDDGWDLQQAYLQAEWDMKNEEVR